MSVNFSACTNLTEIGWGAFDGCTGLTGVLDLSVCISLTEIGEMAFENCTALAKVCLPASLTTIGWRAFNKCNNVQTLSVDPANTAFCSKDNVLYTKDMSALVYAAGGITQVCIPDTVTEICNYAFEGGSSLQTLTVDPANQVYCSKNNIIYTKDMTILVCAAGAIWRDTIKVQCQNCRKREEERQ